MKKSHRYIFATGSHEPVLVSWEDYPLLSHFAWYVSRGYANCSSPQAFDNRLMHRIVSGNQGQCVDHINGNKLDNRRSNLRVCSQVENQQNRHVINKNNTSGVKGVSWFKPHQKWCAEIWVRGKKICLGYFDDKDAAAKARKLGEEKYFTLPESNLCA